MMEKEGIESLRDEAAKGEANNHVVTNRGHDFRIKEANRLRERLQSQNDSRKKLCKSYQRLYLTLHVINIIFSTIVGIIGGYTIISFEYPKLLTPLGITSIVLSAFGIIINIWGNLVNKRVRNHERLWILGYNCLFSLNEILSSSLKDGKLQDKEFLGVLNIHRNYVQECKSVKDAFTRKYASERDDVLNRIDHATRELLLKGPNAV